MGTGQIKALADLGPKFVLPYKVRSPGCRGGFRPQAPRWCWRSASAWAAPPPRSRQTLARPRFHRLRGARARRRRAAQAHRREASIGNIRIVQHDAVEVLRDMIGEADLLAGVHIFFPDPWHKKRHNKRRLIQAPTSSPNWCKHLASPAATCTARRIGSPMPSRCSKCCPPNPTLLNTAAGYADKPAYRPLTKFESSRSCKLGPWSLGSGVQEEADDDESTARQTHPPRHDRRHRRLQDRRADTSVREGRRDGAGHDDRGRRSSSSLR